MAASDTTANAAFIALTAGVSFALPNVDLSGAEFQLPPATGPIYAEHTKLQNSDLTTKVVGGDGTFDVLMSGYKAHLDGEFKANRITGGEYTKAFVALTEGAMGNAVQFLLGRDTAYWQAIGAQLQAQTAAVNLVTARVGLEIAKAQLLEGRMKAEGAKAEYALTKMKLATESVGYEVANFTLTDILPMQRTLLQEQADAQRAQTSDTRSDGQPVTGSVGKQKDLYTQQITSYKRDGELKAIKLYTDAWTVQKTMDEGLVPPNGFTNANIDALLTKLTTNLQLV